MASAVEIGREFAQKGDTVSLGEQVVRVLLDPGMAYYVGIHGQVPSSERWEYNLTILSGGN